MSPSQPKVQQIKEMLLSPLGTNACSRFRREILIHSAQLIFWLGIEDKNKTTNWLRGTSLLMSEMSVGEMSTEMSA